MHHVIVAWAKSNTESFEAQVPLEFLARHYRERGYSGPFKVVVLHGRDKLDRRYADSLADLGFDLEDANGLFSEEHSRFARLDRFGEYELSCFLRWPVLRRLFGADPLIHYDGDVVMNVAPDEVAARFAGTTFVLQGCPALTVVSTNAWYEEYESELHRFAADIDGYSAQAWRERDGWEISAESKWAGQRSRKIVSSDQDLVSHLIHTGRLTQTRKETLLERLGSWMAMENPLYPDAYYPSANFSYRRTNQLDTFNSRPLLMWHMQTSFYTYLSRHLMQARYLPPLAGRRLPRELSGAERFSYRAAARLNRGSPVTRRSVYEAFLEKGDFSEVFTDRRWWKPGVFAEPGQLHPAKSATMELKADA
ncbi:MAG: hypothetical protein M3Q09_10835 [Gemmatimonadota bacterium]|nr:hypothetical protein [Gemmatimonadota bacterium]